MPITAIVAMAQNNAIGIKGTLPWRLPNDLQFFKKMTLGHTVLMGRKSFESIGRPLPNRRNWVLSQQPQWTAPGVEVFPHWQAVQTAFAAQGADAELMIIGGGEIYRATFPYWDHLYLTQVETIIEDADTFFLDWTTLSQQAGWVLEWEQRHERDERHAYPYTFQSWKRLTNTRIVP